jgi:predicted GNAT superfamily acetyltransferase
MTLPLRSTVDIRALKIGEELRAIIPLQRAIWGYSDLEIDSSAVIAVASQFTGQVLGAFDGERLIGFSLALAALEAGRLHSHRVGVLPDYQNLGVGRALKLAQREHALRQNISVIQWTFDPLQPRNAYFNIARLGVVAKTYLPNFYGVTSSPLHGGLPTDRLLAEWHLASDRVQDILSGSQPARASDRCEIRTALADLKSHRSVVQDRFRQEFLDRFSHGYIVRGFRQEADLCSYELERP